MKLLRDVERCGASGDEQLVNWGPPVWESPAFVPSLASTAAYLPFTFGRNVRQIPVIHLQTPSFRGKARRAQSPSEHRI